MFKNLKITWLRYFSLIRNNSVEESPIIIIRINCLLYLINYYLLFVKLRRRIHVKYETHYRSV